MYICSTHLATIRLTGRNEGIFDSIALDEGTKIYICTLKDVSIQCSHIVHSRNGCSVFCSSENSVQCTREGSAKDFTTLYCPIVYPQWGRSSLIVSTDEGELV